ncbi:hypothetical protein ABPG75_008265 [Micractinium tetrahymenae]
MQPAGPPASLRCVRRQAACSPWLGKAPAAAATSSGSRRASCQQRHAKCAAGPLCGGRSGRRCGTRSSIARSGAGGSAAVAARGPAPTSRRDAAAAGTGSGGGSSGECQDVGNAVHLEHVNLEVPDLYLARVFYTEGLGLTPDPETLGWQRGGPFVTWYNIGQQQLHIIKGPAQSTRGTILLKLPPAGSGSLQRTAERLAALEPVLAGTAFGFRVVPSPAQQQQQAQRQAQSPGRAEASASSSSGGSRSESSSSSSSIASIEVTDPWGQRFLLADSLPGFPWPAGIAELQLPCFPGTAHLIARFYSEVLGARVVEDGSGGSSSSSGSGGSGSGGGGKRSSIPSSSSGSSDSGHASAGAAGCRVYLGPGSCLRFTEDPALGEHTAEAAERLWSGWHVAFYVASFSPPFSSVLDLGLNLLDHPYRDKSPDLPAALANRQFRFKDIVHLDGFGKRGELLYCLGHEVRSLHHPGYLRPLHNRRDFAHE